MSVEQQVTELLSGVDNSSAEKAKTNLELARQEVEKLLRATNSSVYDLCMYIERVKNRLEVKRPSRSSMSSSGCSGRPHQVRSMIHS